MQKITDYPEAFIKLLPEIEEKTGHIFNNKEFIITALTHSSFSNEKKPKYDFEYNERLEFLGDSVLSLVASRLLFSDKANYPEGILTKMRASVVCADALFEYATKLDLGKYMLLNHGLAQDGGRHGKNILADCFEALLAAIYLDSGFDEAEKFVLRFLAPKLKELTSGGKLHDDDYKSLLQQKVQTSPGEKIEYRLVKEFGPDHDKSFEVEAWVSSNCIGKGSGKSKREAEQMAAKHALTEWFGQK